MKLSNGSHSSALHMSNKHHISSSFRCGHSPVYRSREMAGRALVPFVMVNQIPSTVQSLLAGLPDYTSPCIRQNPIHGTLLQVSVFFFFLFDAV